MPPGWTLNWSGALAEAKLGKCDSLAHMLRTHDWEKPVPIEVRRWLASVIQGTVRLKFKSRQPKLDSTARSLIRFVISSLGVKAAPRRKQIKDLANRYKVSEKTVYDVLAGRPEKRRKDSSK